MKLPLLPLCGTLAPADNGTGRALLEIYPLAHLGLTIGGIPMSTEITAAFKRPTAFLPIAMSFAAIVVVLVHVVRFGPAPQPDEGATSHLWQLLMGCQVPVIAFFLLRWAAKELRASLVVFATQVTAALAALAPVYFLRW